MGVCYRCMCVCVQCLCVPISMHVCYLSVCVCACVWESEAFVCVRCSALFFIRNRWVSLSIPRLPLGSSQSTTQEPTHRHTHTVKAYAHTHTRIHIMHSVCQQEMSQMLSRNLHFGVVCQPTLQINLCTWIQTERSIKVHHHISELSFSFYNSSLMNNRGNQMSNFVRMETSYGQTALQVMEVLTLFWFLIIFKAQL